KVLGSQTIATYPGRGYRFIGSIESPAQDTGQNETASASAPGPTAPATLRTNLPAELPALLGRGGVLADLAERVAAHRLVTIVGPGGIGKSLLTQHLLHGRRSAYPQGVCWVELGQSDAASLAGTVSSALGVQGGPGAALPALVHALAPLSVLI